MGGIDGLDGPSDSLNIQLTDGRTKSFPTLDDYVQLYVQRGLIKDKNDLLNKKTHFISEIFFDWIKSGQLGCLFAVSLANRASSTSAEEQSRVGWATIVVSPEMFSSDDFAASLTDELDALAQTSQVVQVIIPHVTDEMTIVAMVNRLCAHPRWYWTEIPWSDSDDPQWKLVGLRWMLPDDKHVNQVLGFASIESAPLTRRAPFTAMMLRLVPQKREQKRKYEDNRLVVHLADMDSLLKNQETHDRITTRTGEYKRLLLSKSMLPATRAMITFQMSPKAFETLCQNHTPALREDQPVDSKDEPNN